MAKQKLVPIFVSVSIVVILSAPLLTVLSPRVERPCLDYAPHLDGSFSCSAYGPRSVSLGLSATDYMRRILIPLEPGKGGGE